MDRFIYILYLSVLGVFITIHGYSQDSIEYIVKNNAISLNALQKDNFRIKDKNIFIYGEFHSFKKTDKLAALLFNKISSKAGSRKIYLCEHSKSFEYVLYKASHGMNEIAYGDRDIINIKKDKNFKHSLSVCKKILEDSNVVYLAFDYEHDFEWALICLNDILISSKNKELFHDDIQLISAESIINKGNRDLSPLAKKIISKYVLDTVIYKKALSKEGFYFYEKIISSLNAGLISDSLAKDKKMAYSFREKYLYEQVNKVIKKDSNNIVFIQTGLRHALDSTFIEGLGKWVSMAEMLSKTYNQDNICKFLMVDLKNTETKENFTIFYEEEFNSIKKALKYKVAFMDMKRSFPGRRTKADYVIFYK